MDFAERRTFIIWLSILFGLLAVAKTEGEIQAAAKAPAAAKPPVPLETEGRLGYVTTLADGRLFLVTGDCRPREKWADASIPQPIYGRFSTDGGKTWSDSRLLFNVPGPGWLHMVVPLGTRNGNIHLLGFVIHHLTPPVNYLNASADIWHTVSHDGGKTWETPRKVNWGHRYTGALNSFIELQSGRLLAAFSYMDETRDTGLFVSDAIYSDDGGATWRGSQNDLVIDGGGKGSHSGAIEPVMVQLADGRVWMVIRAQSGYLFESYSADNGDTWSPPKRTQFRSSSAPAAVLRLKDGRLVLVWNNELHSRSSLVMAIRNGGEWKGYREINPPFGPEDQNVGARYPFLTELRDGHILVGYGERGRVHRQERRLAECTTYWNGNTRLFRVDPDWLLETRVRENFSDGLHPLQAQGTQGVTVLSGSGNEPALRLQKTASDSPSGVTWNFPFGKSGKLKIKLQLKPGFKGVYFDLSEYFLQPSEHAGGTFRWMIDADLTLKVKRGGHSGTISRTSHEPYAEELSDIGKIRTRLEAGRPQELAVEWDCETNLAKVTIDGAYGTTLMGMEPSRGIAYLRIGLVPTGTDLNGVGLMGIESQSKP
jgi:hypothetical protein